jgi:hypothetical protein
MNWPASPYIRDSTGAVAEAMIVPSIHQHKLMDPRGFSV